jgi:predicted phage replisome organizer
MAENKKYYWLKLKEDFFEEKQIKYLRKLPDGDKLIIAYLKMQLKSLKTEGFIKYDSILPSNIEELSMILDEDINIITLLINALQKVGAIEILDDGSFYMIAMQDLIGKEGQSAERVRKFRERQKEKEIKMLEEPKQPKTNAQRQRQFRAKKNCEQKQHIPYIEDYINNKRYNGNYYIVIQRDKYKCAICGSIENLCVHHIDGYDEKDFTKSNENKMITLCRNCHSNIHAGNKIDEDILNSIDYYEESNEMLPSNTDVTKCNTEIEIEKDIEIDIKEKKKRKFQPPTLEEIKQYILEKGLKVNAEQFYNYFTEGNWIDAKGNKVKNWKQKLLTWNKYQVDVKEEKKTNYNNYDQRQYDNMEKFYANKL